MEPRSRAIPVLTVVSTALLALVASYVLKNDTKSTLYCVPNDSPFIITTLNGSVPHAKCFHAQDGLFTEVLEEIHSNQDKITFLEGYVLPGIIESHGHILQYGEMLESVLLYGAESVDEVITRIKGFLKAHQGEGYGTREKWIRGIGWDQKYFGGVMPTAVCPSSITNIITPDIV
jgi:predicted amidohydrolase YtcJ